MRKPVDPESLRGAALLGMAQERVKQKRLRAESDRERLDRIQESLEERRMMELAAGIHTEELLQQVLSQIEDHTIRAAVEARIRPHTKIPVDVHG